MTTDEALNNLVRDAQLYVKDNERGADEHYELQAIDECAATIRAALAQRDAEISWLRETMLGLDPPYIDIPEDRNITGTAEQDAFDTGVDTANDWWREAIRAALKQ